MADEETQEAGEKKQKSGSGLGVKIVIIAIIAVALITITTYVAYTVSERVKNPLADNAQNGPQQNTQATQEPLAVFPIGEIKTVIHGRNLKVAIYLAYDDELVDDGFAAELDARKVELLDLSIQVFFEMTEEELDSSNYRKIKQDLRDIINRNLIHGQLIDIYFEGYVYQ